MAKRKRAKYRACLVQTTPAGLLRFRFLWKTPDGAVHKFAEATALHDTAENRQRVERQAEIIGAEIRAGVFDYLKWFPNGNRATEYLAAQGASRPQAKGAKPEGWTVRRYYDEWIERVVPPVVRASAARHAPPPSCAARGR